MILFASASEIARMLASLRPCGHEPLLLPSQKRAVIRRSRKEKTMSCLVRLSGSVGGRTFSGCLVLACAFTLGAVTAGRADEPTVLRVNAFPQAKTLPLHAGIAKGIFERRGFKIELQLTENSRSQRDGLAG